MVENIKNNPWRIQDNTYAIKLVDRDILDSKKIIIPKKLRKFFGVDNCNEDFSKDIIVIYLSGKYKFNVSYSHKKDESILTINDDLCVTLKGFLFSLNREIGGGDIYLAFYRKSSGNYGLKIGMAKDKK